MILAIDMGNTNIEIGCLDARRVLFTERASTDLDKTELEYAMLIQTVLDLHRMRSIDLKGAILSSVVPPLSKVLANAIFKVTGHHALIVSKDMNSGLSIQMDNPETVGADLIVDSAAGLAEYGAPLIIVDMGTATTITVVSKEKAYCGGVILPGAGTALESLVKRTSQLPRISFDIPPHVIGTNTIHSMQSGMMYGQAGQIDSLIDRFEEELGYKCKVIATGGLSRSVIPLCRHTITLDSELMMKGLRILYEMNAEAI